MAMFYLRVWGLSIALTGFTLAAASRPSVTVARTGRGDFRSVQEAVNSFGAAGGTVRIKPGLYEENIVVDKAHITLRGLGKSPNDVVLSWHLNSTAAGGTGKSASTTVTGDDFYAENLTFENTYSRGRPLEAQGSQAVALRVTGDRAVFRRVRFLGYQDTLYAATDGCMNGAPGCRPTRQYFEDCYVEGNVDFIFGDALAYFENCHIHGLAHQVVFVTAQSKARAGQKSGYVFHRAKLTAEAGVGKMYLGRPWRAYSAVVFVDSDLDAKIDPAGWLEWKHDGADSLPTSYYAEFRSKGPGANPGARTPYSHQLTAAEAEAYQRTAFLAGEDHWDPAAVR